MTVLSITTDFGITNGFVGVMKGVIYGIAPEVKIVDISHLISAQNVLEGAYAMWRAAPFFPPGSVHVGVVDPGVGTKRRPIGARLGDQYFIAPDNGLLTPLILDAGQNGDSIEFVHLDNPKYWLPKVSNTFHGRDIFAPVAALLSLGFPPIDFGEAVTSVTMLPLPQPYERPDGSLVGHVLHIDSFGNLITNIKGDNLPQTKQAITIEVGNQLIPGLSSTYAEGRGLLALIGSSGYLEIAVKGGNAHALLESKVGDEVRVKQQSGGSQ